MELRNKKSLIEFVCFHAIPCGDGHNPHPNTNLDNSRYSILISMMFKSALIFHANALCVIITNSNSLGRDLISLTKKVTDLIVKVISVEPKKIMLSRTMAQCDYIQRHDFQNKIVFVDSDIIFKGNVDHIFDYDFDVALTCRNSQNMPINGGLIFVNNTRPKKILDFFRAFKSLYMEKYSNDSYAEWYGDQLALRDILDVGRLDFNDTHHLEILGINVLLLPCETYNFSPENTYSDVCNDLKGKYIIHFKGERKRLMSHYWEAWVRSDYIPPHKRWSAKKNAKRRLQRLSQKKDN